MIQQKTHFDFKSHSCKYELLVMLPMVPTPSFTSDFFPLTHPHVAIPMTTRRALLPWATKWSCTASPTCFMTPACIPPVMIHAPWREDDTTYLKSNTNARRFEICICVCLL